MRFFSLTVRNFKEILRDPITSALGLAVPLLFLVLFSSIEKRIPLDIYTPQNLTPGIAIFSFSFIIMFCATRIAKDKQSAFLIRLFTTPLKPSDYIISYILPFIPFAFLQMLICYVAGLMLGASFSNVPLALLMLMLIAFICINIGVILGSLFTVGQVSGVGSMLVTGIGLFSGVWMDLEMVGGVFQTIGYILPFAHAVDLTKALLSGSDFTSHLTGFYVVLIYAVTLFILAIFAFRRTMRRI